MQALPSAFFHQVSSAVAHLGAARLDGEIDDGCGAADGRGARAGLEVVGGIGAAEGHVEMSVRVDAAGQQQQAGGIDDYVRCRGGNAGADFLDGSRRRSAGRLHASSPR